MSFIQGLVSKRWLFKIVEFSDNVKNFCILADDKSCHPGDPKCSKAIGVKLKGFELKPEAQNSPLCTDLVRPELAYTKKIFQKQWPNWKNFYG